MKKYLFVDLDDTLFQTLGKCAGVDDLRPVGYLKDGVAISYTTPRQRAFFEMMSASMTLIPSTARNLDALRRVDLPFNSYSIIDYGGVVLKPCGSVDEHWLETMRVDMEQALPGLNAVMAVIDDYCEKAGLKGRARLVEDCNTPFYALIKDPDKIDANLEQIEQEAVAPWVAGEGKDFFIHRNGNNLAVLPKTLNKARAVDYVRSLLQKEHGEIMTIGMGDSRSDARFMASCDYALIPNGTQLAKLTVAAL